MIVIKKKKFKQKIWISRGEGGEVPQLSQQRHALEQSLQAHRWWESEECCQRRASWQPRNLGPKERSPRLAQPPHRVSENGVSTSGGRGKKEAPPVAVAGVSSSSSTAWCECCGDFLMMWGKGSWVVRAEKKAQKPSLVLLRGMDTIKATTANEMETGFVFVASDSEVYLVILVSSVGNGNTFW